MTFYANQLRSSLKLLSIVLLLVLSFKAGAQMPPPASTTVTIKMIKGRSVILDSIRTLPLVNWDSIKNMKISEQEIQAYLRNRPNFGDTTGKKQDIVKILRGAKTIVILGIDSNYDKALARAEENFKRRNLVDKVLVVKHERKMYLQKKGVTIKTFKVALGPNPIGQKEYEGDGKTPEGTYTLDWTKWVGAKFSSFHISYPSEADITRAKNKGLTAGSNIMVHGTNGVKKKKDWTNGCIALTNADLSIFKDMVFQDTMIEIVK